MAISQDTLAAGLNRWLPLLKGRQTADAAGYPYFFYLTSGGYPSPGAWGSPGLSGAAQTGPQNGFFEIGTPTSPQLQYLANVRIYCATNVGGAQLIDWLWHNSGITVTTTGAQTINSAAWPSRDLDGSTGGRGVQIAMACETSTTNGSAVTNTTLSYTNSDGTSGRTASLLPNWPATAAASSWAPFRLQGADQGVRSIQSLTLGTSYGGGAVHLVAFVPLARGGFSRSGSIFCWAANAFRLGRPRIYDGACLAPIITPSGTALGRLWGGIQTAYMDPAP